MSWKDILKEETPNQQARRIVKTIKALYGTNEKLKQRGHFVRKFLDEMLEYWEAKLIRTTDTSGWGGDESEDWDNPR